MEQLLDFFTPKNYNLHLKLNKQDRTIYGSVEISGDTHSNLIKLHATKVRIIKVMVDDTPAAFECDGKILSISTTPNQPVNINIQFESPIYPAHEAMTGAYISTYEYKGRQEEIIATQFEPNYASKVFPCVDEPAAKATFKLSIETDKDDTVLSNMPISSTSDAHLKKTTFETSPRMSPYLLAFATGKFKSYSATSQHGVAVTSYAPLCQPDQLLIKPTETAAKTLDYYTDLFDTPYPLPKLDQVSLPDFEAGAMENWGLITYRESMFLCDDSSPIDTLHESAVTIAHEVSHQWFGNLVTMQWWDDLWLNEAFATLMAYFAVDKLYSEYDIWNNFFLSYVVAALNRDCLTGVQSVHQEVHDPAEIATLFDASIVYAKGARLMLMLLREMGEDNFYAGLKRYFNDHAYLNTTGDDLWNALQPFANFDVKQFMHAWIDQPGYPVLDGDKQQRFLIDQSPDKSRWPIPHPRDDLSGHYIIRLSDDELDRKLEHFDQLEYEQKLRILFDRSLLARTKAVETASFIDIVQHLSGETSYPIWDATAHLLSTLKLFVEHHKPAEADYKHFVRNITSKQASRLGLEPRPDESLDDTQLRPIILCFSSYSENREVIDAGLKLYNNTPIDQLDPNTRGNILLIKVKYDETPELIEQFIELYKTTVDPDLKSDLLLALTSTRKTTTIKQLLKLLHQIDIIRPQDTLSAFASILHNRHGEQLAYDWIYANWGFVEKLCGDQDLDDYIRLLAGTITTEVEQHRFIEFFTPLLKNPALSRAIEVAIPQIAAKIAYIKQDQPEVVRKLKNLANHP